MAEFILHKNHYTYFNNKNTFCNAYDILLLIVLLLLFIFFTLVLMTINNQ